MIWEDLGNRSLRSKRGVPENLRPGDVLVIPPDQHDQKMLQKKADALREQLAAAKRLRTSLVEDLACAKKREAIIQELIKDTRQNTEVILKELKANLNKMKRWGDGVDLTKNLIDIGSTLAKLTTIGLKAGRASASELKKLNEEAVKEAVDMLKGQRQDAAVKMAKSWKDSASTALQYTSILADSWDKMTSPSFWANNWVQIVNNGKSWSEAVTMELGDDIKQRILEIETLSRRDLQKLEQQLKAQKTASDRLEDLLRQCDELIKQNERGAASLERFPS
ncbi:hypothetical protein GCM10011504_58980 [Siccirubricoccus deserti]|uniref:hypothetical protein n=1 Tax=Siccirubricoccus deserti TaxID=2013562 RepID=UPI0019C63101|nr:hypothetical protein GCM10011504_58980 [Siccirubricoccus deserti]